MAFTACLNLENGNGADSTSGDDSQTTISGNAASDFEAGELVWACPDDGSVSTSFVSHLAGLSVRSSSGQSLATGQGLYAVMFGHDAADYDQISMEPESMMMEVFVIELTDQRVAVAQTKSSPDNWTFNESGKEWIQTKIYFYESDHEDVLDAVIDTLANYKSLHGAGFNLGDQDLLQDLDAREDLDTVAMITPKLTPVGGNTQVTRLEENSYTFSTTIAYDEITLYVSSDFTDYAGGFAQYTGLTLAMTATYDDLLFDADFPEYSMTANADGTYSIEDGDGTRVNTYSSYDSFDPYSVFYDYCGFAGTSDNPITIEL